METANGTVLSSEETFKSERTGVVESIDFKTKKSKWDSESEDEIGREGSRSKKRKKKEGKSKRQYPTEEPLEYSSNVVTTTETIITKDTDTSIQEKEVFIVGPTLPPQDGDFYYEELPEAPPLTPEAELETGFETGTPSISPHSRNQSPPGLLPPSTITRNVTTTKTRQLKPLLLEGPYLSSCRHVDNYEKLNRIEEGTYGVVYRARDRSTDEIVALKRLKLDKEKNGFPVTSLREIHTLLLAKHENIVNVREIVVGHNLSK